MPITAERPELTMHEHLPLLLNKANTLLRDFGHVLRQILRFADVGFVWFRGWPGLFSGRPVDNGHATPVTSRDFRPGKRNLCKTDRQSRCRDNIFMITGPARTGSTLLVHLLRSHPDICSHSEVFSPIKITGLTGTHLEKSSNEPDFFERLSAERDRDPIKFLYKIALDSQGKKVVGFKLKHDELVLPEYRGLRDEIAGDSDFRIIHLRRENLLRRFLSWYIANHITHLTLAVGPQNIPEVPAVRLDPYECQRDFETTLKREKEFRELFATHKSFSISYEELATGNNDKIFALLDFLEVRPRKLTTTTKRMGNDDVRAAIANFDELRSHFAGTQFAHFFEDTRPQEADCQSRSCAPIALH